MGSFKAEKGEMEDGERVLLPVLTFTASETQPGVRPEGPTSLLQAGREGPVCFIFKQLNNKDHIYQMCVKHTVKCPYTLISNRPHGKVTAL